MSRGYRALVQDVEFHGVEDFGASRRGREAPNAIARGGATHDNTAWFNQGTPFFEHETRSETLLYPCTTSTT